MEGKTFNLIEKLYIEVQSMRSEMATKQDLASLKTELKQDMVRMEDKFDTKLGALFDGLSANTEAINTLRSEMKTLETKVDDHEVKLKIVK